MADKMTETTTTEYVTLKDLAKAIGMDRSIARKVLIKSGVPYHWRRTPGGRGQQSICLDRTAADEFVERRRRDGFLDTKPIETNEALPSDGGVFYLIRLAPDLDPRRIKFGFSDLMARRIMEHRTSAPTVEIVKTWPCMRAWESVAMAAATKNHCRLILSECFECDDVDAVIIHLDAFFALLPLESGS